MRTPLVEGQIADQAEAHGLGEDEVVGEVMLAPAAIKRLIEPEEVAEAVAYLCSEPRPRSPARRSPSTAAGARTECATGENAGRDPVS